MLFINGPLELNAEARVTPTGVAIRLQTNNAGANQWADVWIEEEDLTRWLRDIDDARKRQTLERQGVSHLLSLQRQLAGPPGPEPDNDRLCKDCDHSEHAGECPNRYCLCLQPAAPEPEADDDREAIQPGDYRYSQPPAAGGPG